MDRNKVTKRLFFWYAILWVLLIIALYLAFGVYFVDTTTTKSKWVGLFAGSIAILLAACKMLEISLFKSVNPLFKKISQYFINGLNIFNFRIIKIALAVVFLSACFLIKKIGVAYVTSFLIGCAFNFLVIYITSLIAAKITTRSSQFYNESMQFALRQFFNCGTAISCIAVAFSIIPIVVLFHVYKDYQVINGFVLGATLIALLNNVSNIAVKQASISAENVVLEMFPQFENNDRRNPLLLLSGISRGIFDVNILSSDLFTLFSIVLISSMTIGGEFLQLMGAFLPIIILSCGIFSSIIVNLFTNLKNTKNPIKQLFVSMFFANLIFCCGTYFLIKNWLPTLIELTAPVVIGAIGGFVVSFLYVRYANEYYKPAINVSNSILSSFENAFKQTLKEGCVSVFVFAFILAICVITSFLSSGGIIEPSLGVYGITLCALGMLAVSVITIAIYSFGFATKNVDVVLESYEEDICDKQNIVANSLSEIGTKAVSLFKAYINSATVFASIAVLITYSILAGLEQADILNPYVMGSLLLGVATPFLYCGFVVGIISKVAQRIVLEVKKQIRTYAQILRYEIRPDYEKCVNIAAINSSIQVIVVSAIAVLIFSLILIKLDIEALLGYVIGVILSSFGLVFLTSATSVIGKSARRYCEKEFNYSQKQNEINAISINESIFASIKDTVSISLNSLMKFLAVLALSVVPFLIF
ncbi:sodium/proton-translocating pyrophosphatase [bacterium]|nr:sodium/proton-translocating pyrophosphatase [bacterium]